MGWHRVKLPGLATRVLTSPIWAVAAGAIRRIWPLMLFGWFAWQTYQRMSILVTYHYPMGIDAQIYYRGVVAWLAGGNPWDAAVMVNGFALPLRRLAGDDRGHGTGRPAPRGRVHRRLADPD